ncbi:Nif3-like dinuclear metal center hexameric protein [Borreliella valaisiana]|uniref:GTP cyclohydrolase 1 type 2 homolog n=1 Tax=Borreliella valaisiana VS116 TaxID=445987 RepID=D6RXV5_BORVA|nr:Nif3-like dinuclear metal center hexameric protein [Borreliella valaisiana]AIJ29825.1 hypothetical protein P613_02395 [Borreliella valaisiana Tom4006]EEF81887.1 conserved hypothetical protein [Borreliella valaisiana VS116]
MNVRDLSFKLNSIFDIKKYEHVDKNLNGLQVGSLDAKVSKVAFAVDASYSVLKEAKGNDFLITHHGIFWSKKERIVSNMYDKMKFLIENNLALYSVHLPMDAHSIYSHSKVFADFLGLKNPFAFANYGGFNLGVIADSSFSFSEILEKIKKENKHILFSKKFKESVNKVAIVSGSGYSFFEEALCHGIDLFITGDTSHQIYSLAEECGVSLIFAGHYFTETFGLIKLMQDFKIQEDLEVEFICKNTNL